MSPAGEMDPRGLPLADRSAVVTVGSFDGVHRGHVDVLQRLVARARAVGRPSVVVTFEPHPLEVVNPAAAPPRLTLRPEKLEQLAAVGVDYVVVLPFTPALAACEADRFVREILLARLGMAELLVGHDHGFGRGRLGDIEALRALGRVLGFGVTVLAPVCTASGVAISSTGIRRSVAGGDLGRAAGAHVDEQRAVAAALDQFRDEGVLVPLRVERAEDGDGGHGGGQPGRPRPGGICLKARVSSVLISSSSSGTMRGSISTRVTAAP